MSLVDQSSDPAGAANSSTLYAKGVSGASQLFWRSEAGPAVQLTAAGGLRAESLVGTVADARLSNNVPLKNASNAFTSSGSARTNAAIRVVSNAPYVRFTETDQAEDAQDWLFGIASGNLVLGPLSNNATQLLEAQKALSLVRSDTALTSIAIGNAAGSPTITLNGVNITDYARLSQQNPFTGATQTVSAANANWLATNGTVSMKIQALSTNDTGVVGTQSNHELHFFTNNASRGSVGTDGSFHLPVVATSTSTTLAAGQIHVVTGNSTLPNMTTGQWVGVINNSASPITVTKNASDTMYWTASGSSVTSVTVAARGKVTFFCADGTNVYASGNITGAS